jgi:hypothetical protein
MAFPSRVIYSILFFTLLIILLYQVKFSVMFESNGDLKNFGLGSDKTLFSFGIFTVILAILSFYLFCIIDMIFKK